MTEPGTIGREPAMTRGDRHAVADRALELYPDHRGDTPLEQP